MKFFIKTYGCSHNQADSIIMSNLLKLQGYEQVFDESKADYLIVNTCTVKTPTEQKIKRYIQDNKDKKIIIAGCMIATHKELFKNYSLIGCNNLFDIVKIVKGEKKESIKNNNQKIKNISISKNEVIEIVPISKGCLGNCTYCATKFARGKLYSYEIKDILNQIKVGVKNNKKEFWLTAEDTGCYGFDKNTNLINLLNEIIKIKSFFKIRIGMMNPKYAILYKKELSKILNNEKFYKFIHIPIQSGSDKILKLMNRHYNKKEFNETINYLKNNVKNITIATDIIVGFPSETKKEFNETYELIKKLKPQVMNLSKYWNRPFTKADKMTNQVSLQDKKSRAIKIMNLHKKHNKERKKILDYALVNEKGFARTNNYTKIKSDKKLGTYYKL
jgi:threonylcarbamoyladenosine tRNA methylthiotransferase CDKAL1